MNDHKHIKTNHQCAPQTCKRICLLFFCTVFIISSAVIVNAQASVKLYPSVIRVQKGKSKTITAVAYNSSGQPVFDAAFTNFTAANSGVASSSFVPITADDISIPSTPPPNLRNISGLSAGVTSITASWNGILSSPATVVVDDPALAPTAVVRGDNEENGGMSISTKVGEAIELNGELSQGVEKMEWNWGDGDKTVDLLSATHAYVRSGTYLLTLRVTNNAGQTASSPITVNVAPHSQPTQIIHVSTIAQLLIAYNNATGGEHIVIPAGTVLAGEIELPARNFTDYVTIRSSAVMPDLTDRVSPVNPGLVTLRGTYYNAIPLVIKNGASKIRLVGLKFDPMYLPADTHGPSAYYLAQIGESFTQSDVSQNPSKIILEHCVVNPPDDVNVVHAVLNDGYKVSIISSWLGNIKTFGGQDSQAVVSFDGRGAHVYNNTFFEAATENVMYGGVVPSIKGLTSTNIEFRRSHFSKRLSWRVYSGEFHKINVKNLFETKNARRVYVESSILENHWDAYRSQRFALVFKSATSPGTEGEFVPWAVSEDIVFENNRVSHTNGGVTTSVDSYWMGPFHGLLPNNITIRNTLFDDMSTRWSVPGLNIGGMFLQPNSVSDLQIDHTTITNQGEDIGSSIFFVTNNNFRFTVKNTIFPRNVYGVGGSGVGMATKALNPGTGGSGDASCLRAASASWNFAGNVMPFSSTFSSCMPFQAPYINNYPQNVADIGFTDPANGDFRLSNSSQFRLTATDGTDPGVNMPMLDERIACTVSGTTGPCISGGGNSEVTVSGRVMTTNFRNVSKTAVVITNANGEQRHGYTNPFGFYTFENVPTGLYTISISSKRFSAQSITASVSANVNNIFNITVND